MTTIGEQYREFFQPLVDDLAGQLERPSRRATASQDQWFYSGFKGITYNMGFWYQDGPHVVAYLWIATGDESLNNQIHRKLKEQRSAIESAMGNELFWFEAVAFGSTASIGRKRMGDSIHHEYRQLRSTRKWMIDNITQLKCAIQPHLEMVGEEMGLEKNR